MHAVNESVSMQQVLLPTYTPTVKPPFYSDSPSNEGLGSCELQTLKERLRLTYGPVEAPLPARLAELVERLARREQAKD
jgi:hypothetical protein